MDRERFEQLVVKAIENLPEEFLALMDNVDVVVEDYATVEQLESEETEDGTFLLGLYEGIPQTCRGSYYGMVVPDKITIFQKAIESVAVTDDEIEQQIQKTVRHEIAHHFGSSEETLRKIEGLDEDY
ncbi:MAG: metallopeptidase family protein [Dehalococcoidales bacterium]|jgi:predicted Zn-dependent protease with MMP-like domain|nr:metallopeptidase family protein [Dehalococcoidales bacterium]